MSADYQEELTPRAEIFRSKLIEDFQLLASFNNSSTESPKYYSSDLCGKPIFVFFSIFFSINHKTSSKLCLDS